MKEHNQDIVDEVLGSMYRHRTLSTLFDSGSSEWKETTIDKKLEILKKLLASNKAHFQGRQRDVKMDFSPLYEMMD